MNRFLPIGSIVTLSGYREELLIIGYKAKKNNELFDYVGVIMPFGYVNNNEYVFFNKDDIKLIMYVGYQNPLSIMYTDRLESDGDK